MDVADGRTGSGLEQADLALGELHDIELPYLHTLVVDQLPSFAQECFSSASATASPTITVCLVPSPPRVLVQAAATHGCPHGPKNFAGGSASSSGIAKQTVRGMELLTHPFHPDGGGYDAILPTLLAAARECLIPIPGVIGSSPTDPECRFLFHSFMTNTVTSS